MKLKFSNLCPHIIGSVIVAVLLGSLFEGCAGSHEKHAQASSSESRMVTTQTHSTTIVTQNLFSAASSSQPMRLTPTGVTIEHAAAIPDSGTLQRLVDEAYAKFKDDKSGTNANYIPYLASVPSDLYGVAIATADG